MPSPNTVIFDGTTYTVQQSGGVLGSSDLIISPGSAAVDVDAAYDATIDLSALAFGENDIFSNAFATDYVEALAIDYESTLNNSLAFAYISGTALDLDVNEGIATVNSGGTVAAGQFSGKAVKEYLTAGSNDTASTFIFGAQYDSGLAIDDLFTNYADQWISLGGVGELSTVINYAVLTDYGTLINPLAGTFGSATIFPNASLIGGATIANGGSIAVQTGASAEGTITIENGGILSIPYADIVAQGVPAGAELLLTGTSLSLSQPREITLAPTGILSVGATAITFANGANAVLEETPLASGIEITQEATCFARGTHVQTPNGEVKVEKLEIGDVVSLHDGGQATIKFVGTRSYNGKFIAGQHLALPVTFHKNSIAKNTPARDLIVSPGHGMFIDGVIVPAWRLVNGRSVTQAAAVERVDYFHIELAHGHGILLAEHCPAESYLDIGTRNQFHNAAAFYSRYPGDAVSPESCFPRIESGFVLEAIQNRIAARAGIAIPDRRNGGLRGFVDRAGDDVGRGERVVSGWAQDTTQPEMPVILYVAVDDQPVMRILANQYRADLRAAGLGSGCHGFEVTLPLGMQGRVDVRQAVSGAILPLTEAAAAMEGSLRPLRAVRAA